MKVVLLLQIQFEAKLSPLPAVITFKRDEIFLILSAISHMSFCKSFYNFSSIPHTLLKLKVHFNLQNCPVQIEQPIASSGLHSFPVRV